MATLEKHVSRAPGLKAPMKMTMKDTATEGMKKQMDYTAQSKKSDNTNKMPPQGKVGSGIKKK